MSDQYPGPADPTGEPGTPVSPVRPPAPVPPSGAQEPVESPAQPGYPPAPAYPGAPAYPPAAYPPAPAYPSAAGYPPAPAAPGYPGYPAGQPGMPGYGGYPGMPVYPGSDLGFTVPGMRDPLVTAPGEGVGGWFSRLFKAFGLHLRTMYLVGLATFGIPSAVFGVLLGVYGPTTTERLDPTTGRNTPEMHFDHVGAFLVLALIFVVVSGFLGALGQGAFVWTLTRRAVDAPAPVGGALRYGAANAFRLWGWTLLYGLIVGVGICACVLPGLYLLVAGSLYIPVLLYQRGANPVSTSFSMINKNFGSALGRLVLLFLLVIGAQLVLQIPSAIVTATVSTAAGRVVDVVTTLVGIPLTFATVLGAVLLFAELRARQHPLTSADLNAAL